jgi:hypothetical protein
MYALETCVRPVEGKRRAIAGHISPEESVYWRIAPVGCRLSIISSITDPLAHPARFYALSYLTGTNSTPKTKFLYRKRHLMLLRPMS